MARRARQVFAGEVHLAMLLAKPGNTPLQADTLRHSIVAQLRDDAAALGVAVHGFCLLPHAISALVTPRDAAGLALLMKHAGQTITRAQAVSVESPWEGRYRCTAFDASSSLDALFAVEAQLLAQPHVSPVPNGISSYAHWTGNDHIPWLAPLASVWALGNTPFGRQAAYQSAFESFVQTDRPARVFEAAKHGWPQGSAQWLHGLAQQTGSSVQKKPPGRKLSPIKN